MKKQTLCLFILLALLSGCCTTRTLVSANGNVGTGDVGGILEVTACTPMEKEVADRKSVV